MPISVLFAKQNRSAEKIFYKETMKNKSQILKDKVKISVRRP